MLNFQQLNLNPIITDALEKKGYSTPTPIQAQAIPHLLEGKDLLGIAQTGTGKTAAFSLPILDRLSQNKKEVGSNQIRALILTPTRELAVQIGENIELYGKGLKLKHAVIFGGVSEFHQIKALRDGLDIVIATPGRLLDLTNQGYVRFSQVEIFVLDEADRMLDLGFINDIRKIIAKLPEKKQSLLFSATMPEAISKLVNSILNNPVKIEITPQSTTVERINQKVYLVDKSHKPALLLDIVVKEDVVAGLVFCKTKHGANKVVTHLEKYGVSVSAIHGNKSQSAREKALKDLRAGKIKVLIATDIAARGIDVSSISHVINYDVPLDPESYVHRIGRTARAGREGIAISFCDSSENLQLRAIEKIIGMKIPVDNSHSFYGKTPIHDSTQGRILSRGPKNTSPSNNRFGKKVSNDRNLSEKNNDRRKHENNPNRDHAPRSSNSQDSNSNTSRNRPFSKPAKSNKDRFAASGNEVTSEGRDSTAKKILRKISFGKLGRNVGANDRNQRDGESLRDNPRSKSGSFNRNKKSNGESNYSSRKKPFNKNRKSF